MTRRLYYDDAYTTSFQTDVLERADYNGHQALVFQETFFYPTSGGQPHDLGTIDGLEVVNVINRPEDDAILHLLQNPISAGRITAEIDWNRRFAHMQQHSGQHILSQSFLRILETKTISFHLGAKTSTVDIELSHLADDEADAVEELANQVIWENRTVEQRLVTREEALSYLMRKAPPVVSEKVRLLVISDFDVSACGGTHVSNTGEIGLLKVIGWERRRDSIRVEFVCGKRALSDYHAKNRVVRNLSVLYTTGYRELENSVSNQIDKLSEQRRLLREYRKTIIDYQVAEILNQAQINGEAGSIVKVFTDVEPKELRIIANQLISKRQLVTLLASVGERTSLVFARDEASSGDMNQLLKQALTMLGAGSGGGSESFAQGSSESCEISKVVSVLDAIRDLL